MQGVSRVSAGGSSSYSPTGEKERASTTTTTTTSTSSSLFSGGIKGSSVNDPQKLKADDFVEQFLIHYKPLAGWFGGRVGRLISNKQPVNYEIIEKLAEEVPNSATDVAYKAAQTQSAQRNAKLKTLVGILLSFNETNIQGFLSHPEINLDSHDDLGLALRAVIGLDPSRVGLMNAYLDLAAALLDNGAPIYDSTLAALLIGWYDKSSNEASTLDWVFHPFFDQHSSKTSNSCNFFVNKTFKFFKLFLEKGLDANRTTGFFKYCKGGLKIHSWFNEPKCSGNPIVKGSSLLHSAAKYSAIYPQFQCLVDLFLKHGAKPLTTYEMKELEYSKHLFLGGKAQYKWESEKRTEEDKKCAAYASQQGLNWNTMYDFEKNKLREEKKQKDELESAKVGWQSLTQKEESLKWQQKELNKKMSEWNEATSLVNYNASVSRFNAHLAQTQYRTAQFNYNNNFQTNFRWK